MRGCIYFEGDTAHRGTKSVYNPSITQDEEIPILSSPDGPMALPLSHAHLESIRVGGVEKRRGCWGWKSGACVCGSLGKSCLMDRETRSRQSFTGW